MGDNILQIRQTKIGLFNSLLHANLYDKGQHVINLTDTLKRKEEKKNQWLNYKPDYEK